MNNNKNNSPEMLAVGGYFLLQLAASFAVALLGMVYFFLSMPPNDLTGDALMQALNDFLAGTGLSMIAGSNVFILIVLFIISRVKGRGFLAHCKLNTRLRGKYLGLSVLAGFFANFWLSFLLNSGVVPEKMLENYEAAFEPLSSGSLPLELFTLIILAPLVEEILYRGLILSHLKNIVPPGAAIFFQGMLFGAMHGDPIWIAYACALGCVIGLVRVRCASLWAGVAFHAVFNASTYLFAALSDAIAGSHMLQTFLFVGTGLCFLVCMWEICTPRVIAK